MVLHEPGAAGDAPTRIGPPPAPSSAEASAVRPLNVPLLCWHESACSARTDPLVALAEEAGFIATDRPLPVGTPVFLELSLGHASNAARAQIDAVVVSGDAPVEMAGFNVRFVDVDPAVLTWIGRHLESAAQKRSAPARVVEEPPSPPPPRETAPETVQEPAPETAAATADDDDLPELVDFEELGVREAEPEGAASEPAPDEGPPSLDREVEAALGDFSADDALAVEDAFSSSFSPWVDLPEAEADDAAPLALAREPEAPLAALPEPPAAAPPEPPTAAPPEPPAAALPEPPAAALSAKEPEVFDPFADTDEPDAPAPEAAAPLASDEFVERSGDDVEVDVFDDGFEDAPAAFAPGAAPGLAEAGVGLSNPFARGAGGPAPDDEIGDTDATREELPRALPERDPPIAETLPWGLDRRTVLEAAEARAEGFPAPTAQASPSPVLPPPAPPAPGGLAPPAPAPTGLAPPLAGGSEEPSSPGVPSAPSAAPFGKATPEGVTPIFGTRPPSGLFRAPEAPAAPPAPSAPLPSPPSGPPSAPEPTFVSTAPYSVAPGPSPDPAPGLGAAPGGPSAATPLEQLQRFPETQRFGVAPGGPPVGGGFPGSPAPTPAPLRSPPPAAAPAGGLAAGAGPLEETERYRIGGPAPGTPAPAPGAPAAAPGAPGAPFRTPTLEFPQPGPAEGPAAAPPRPHTATLREFAAVNAPPSAPTPPAAVPPAAPAAVTAAVPSPSADEVTGAMPLAPGPRSLQVPAPEDDIVEVSTTSQIVRAGEGGLEALVAKDRAARLDLPMQSITGGRDAFTVSSEAFPDAGADLDPFADLDVGPPPALPSGPAPAAAQAQAEPDIWYPGDPPRTPEQGPPTGVYGAAAERPAEAWQVRGPASQPTSPAPGEPEELPLVAGVVVLEEELPLVEARPLEEEPPANEPWVIGGPGRDGPKR